MPYNIHEQLQLHIVTSSQRQKKYFKNEYQRVSVKNVSKSPIKISAHIVSRLPSPKKGDRKRSLRFKKIFNYSYVIRNFETEDVEIYFRNNASAILYPDTVTLFLQAQIIEPIIYLKLLQRNILLMHAAGLSDGKNGYLFPAYGGTGKTTLSLGLMREGMDFLGDDLLIVEPDKQTVYPYLRPLHIFSYNIKTLRDAAVPWSIKAQVKAKDILRLILEKTTRQEFLISTRIHADTLYDNIATAKPSIYKKICFLKKTGDHEKVVINKKTIDAVARKILESEDLNDSLYKNILNPGEKKPTQKLELKVIKEVLSKLPYIEFINTRKLDFRQLADFKEHIKQSASLN